MSEPSQPMSQRVLRSLRQRPMPDGKRISSRSPPESILSLGLDGSAPSPFQFLPSCDLQNRSKALMCPMHLWSYTSCKNCEKKNEPPLLENIRRHRRVWQHCQSRHSTHGQSVGCVTTDSRT